MRTRAYLVLVCAAALAVCAYTESRPEIFRATFADILAYRWMPIALAAIATGAMALPAEWRLQACLGITGVGIALYLLEFHFSFSEKPLSSTQRTLKTTEHYALQSGRPFDGRLGTQVIDDEEKLGHRVYWTIGVLDFIRNPQARTDDHGNWRPPVTFHGRDLVPLGAIPNSDNLYCNESGKWFIFHSDRYGFNNPDWVWDRLSIDVAFVGPSIALGACLQPGESIVDRVREKIPGTIALGSGGANARVYLALLVEYLSRVKPKIVFWLYYAAPNLLAAERGDKWLDRYRRGEPALGIMEATAELAPLLLQWHDQKRALYRQLEVEAPPQEFSFKNFMKLVRVRDRLGLNQCVNPDQDMGAYQEILTVARRTVEEWGGKLVVVELPPINAGCPLFNFERSPDNWLKRQFHAAAAGASVDVIDLYPAFIRQPNSKSLYFYLGSHYSPEGAKLIGDTLVPELKRLLQ